LKIMARPKTALEPKAASKKKPVKADKTNA
jgi:hypothetical protein